jgi:hypothetical protein
MKNFALILVSLVALFLSSCTKDEVIDDQPMVQDTVYLNHEPVNFLIQADFDTGYSYVPYYFDFVYSNKSGEKVYVDKITITTPSGQTKSFSKEDFTLLNEESDTINYSYDCWDIGTYSITITGKFFIDNKPFTFETNYYALESNEYPIFGFYKDGGYYMDLPVTKNADNLITFSILPLSAHSRLIAYVKISKETDSGEVTICEYNDVNTVGFYWEYLYHPTATGTEIWHIYATNTAGINFTGTIRTTAY